MSELDFMPAGRSHRKPDPRYAKKIREGAKRADLMRAHREQHHQSAEIPTAENELEKDLMSFPSNRESKK